MAVYQSLIHTLTRKPTTTRSNPFIIPKSISVQCRPYNRALLVTKQLCMNRLSFDIYIACVLYTHTNSSVAPQVYIAHTECQLGKSYVPFKNNLLCNILLYTCNTICHQDNVQKAAYPGRLRLDTFIECIMCVLVCYPLNI